MAKGIKVHNENLMKQMEQTCPSIVVRGGEVIINWAVGNAGLNSYFQ